MSKHLPTSTAWVALALIGLASCTKPAPQTATTIPVDSTGTPDATVVGGEAPKPNDQMQAVLDQLTALGGKPIEKLSADSAQLQPTPADAVAALLKSKGKPVTPMPVGSVVNRTIPGPGGPLPIRIYTPEGDGPFPLIVYYHGGGWVIATNDTYDASPRALVNATNAVVVSVEYRKAPAHPFPAAHDDALAAYKWVLENGMSIKGDTARVALVGESAGGNLAAATSLAAKQAGIKLPVYQVLVYPVAGTDTTTASYLQNANAKPLNRAMMGWFLRRTISSPADLQDPRLNLVAADLSGMPPTTIVNAQIDPLRTEGEQLAARLRAAGVKVRQKTFAGVTHEFFGMTAAVDQAQDAVIYAADGLNSALKGK